MVFFSYKLKNIYNIVMRDIIILAHRGMSYNLLEENSLEALCRIKNVNSKFKLGLEFDVQITLDNELILFHDFNLEDLVIEDSLYLDILKKNKNITKLEDVLKEFNNTDYILNIELKNYKNSSSRIKIFYEILLNIINKYNIKYLISSYNQNLINEIKKKEIKNCFHISEDLKETNVNITSFDLYKFYSKIVGVYTLYNNNDFDENIIKDIIDDGVIYLITDNVEKLNDYLNRILI